MRIDPYSRTGLALIFGPLYLGPVLAGWARLSPVTLPVFALAFLLFIAATRRPNLNEASGVAALVLMALVQCALVAEDIHLGLVRILERAEDGGQRRERNGDPEGQGDGTCQ